MLKRSAGSAPRTLGGEGRPNERLEQTKSTPRLTAEGVAFAAQSRCCADKAVVDRDPGHRVTS